MSLFRNCSRKAKINVVRAIGTATLYGFCLLLPEILAVTAAKHNAKRFCGEPDNEAACTVFEETYGYTVASSISTNAGLGIITSSEFAGGLALAIIYGCMYGYNKMHPSTIQSDFDGSAETPTRRNIPTNCYSRLWDYTTRFFNYIAPLPPQRFLLMTTLLTLTVTGIAMAYYIAFIASIEICNKNEHYNASDPTNEPLCRGYNQSTADLHPMQMLKHQTNDIIRSTAIPLGIVVNIGFTILAGAILTCWKNRREN